MLKRPFLAKVSQALRRFPSKAQIFGEIRNKYVGEARLLLGWLCADKVSKFDDVQWIDKELTSEDEDILYGTRDDRETSILSPPERSPKIST